MWRIYASTDVHRGCSLWKLPRFRLRQMQRESSCANDLSHDNWGWERVAKAGFKQMPRYLKIQKNTGKTKKDISRRSCKYSQCQSVYNRPATVRLERGIERTTDRVYKVLRRSCRISEGSCALWVSNVSIPCTITTFILLFCVFVQHLFHSQPRHYREQYVYTDWLRIASIILRETKISILRCRRRSLTR